MKTPEDEAFDDLARKQGAWGGGFKAKQAMAMDKLQEPVQEPAQEPVECLDCGSHNVGIPATYDSLVNSVKAQPAQEPVREALKLALEALEISTTFMPAIEKQTYKYHVKPAITAIKEALAQPAQEPDWKEQYEYQKRRAEMWIAKYEKDIGPLEKVQPAQEPVAWAKYDLDRMAVAFDRVIDAHHSKTNPFHNPINADAVLALRILRGFIPAMKVYTTTPQREWVGLTDDDKAELAKAQHSWEDLCLAVEAKLKEKNTCQQ